jgi:hypothetical protein
MRGRRGLEVILVSLKFSWTHFTHNQRSVQQRRNLQSMNEHWAKNVADVHSLQLTTFWNPAAYQVSSKGVLQASCSYICPWLRFILHETYWIFHNFSSHAFCHSASFKTSPDVRASCISIRKFCIQWHLLGVRQWFSVHGDSYFYESLSKV